MKEIKITRVEAFPCIYVNCVSYQTYFIYRPTIAIGSEFPTKLVACLFCDKFLRQYMFQQKPE